MAADTTPTESEATFRDLRRLITSVRYVLWDLDGPMCGLFAKHSARKVADRLVSYIDEEIHQPSLVTEEERSSGDPHAMLVEISRRQPGSQQVAELEDLLTSEELLAAQSAVPTPHATELIKTWSYRRVMFAIVTNNSASAARHYVSAQGLSAYFACICGRTRDLRLMKPHPHSLLQALDVMHASPERALMLGDAVTDYAAAQAAGVGFLGYADSDPKADDFREAGVRPSRIVRSLGELRGALNPQ